LIQKITLIIIDVYWLIILYYPKKTKTNEVLILWARQLPRMVYRLDLSIDENSKIHLIKTAVKIKLIFAQLITHYL
jgi:hypothetical protein